MSYSIELTIYMIAELTSQNHSVPDPIQGIIELPIWLIETINTPAIRRMMFIRQLGLKAYLDFPGAIHTRYSHSLGTMHLAGRMADMLSTKMKRKGKEMISSSLNDNKNNIAAAGFFHDVAHGPFSHAVDFVMQKIIGKTHEQLAEEIIKKFIPSSIEDWGINRNAIVQLIMPKKHRHPFLGQLINGPLDSDKLDYLLRDAYHVGLRYSFDLNQFLRSYTIIGDEQDISGCILGLDPRKESIVTAELFIMIWKSMYDLVYYAERSRIAEKMLEKAILLNQDDETIKEAFKLNEFLKFDDEAMLSLIERLGETEHLLAPRDPRRLYSKVIEKELNKDTFDMTTKFLAELGGNSDKLSDVLSLQLNDEFTLHKYELICDIVKSRVPREIYLDEVDESLHEVELRARSDVIGAIRPRNVIKVYAAPPVQERVKTRDINEKLQNMIEGSLDYGKAD